jgi:hypothetical protein
MTAPVGADVESICTKCGDVWHVVVAKVGDRIAKVQCKQCSGFHRYKPPEGSTAAKATKTTRAAKSAAPGAPAAKKTRARKVVEPAPPKVAPDMSKPVRRYSAAETYIPGDRINHPSFGLGVVESSPGAGKVQVVFSEGKRVVLAVAKAASTLDRPTNRPHG